MNKLPPKEYILERYEYNPETGIVTNKKLKRQITSKSRYLKVKLKGIGYQLHRVIWYMQTGTDPAVDGLEIDHINHDGKDNRWSNLRVCSRSDNQCNRRSWGITKNVANQWVVRVISNSEILHHSTHECPLIARMTYVDAKRELHGEYSGV